MFDYSMNSFQRETFIKSYDVDPEAKDIMVSYANGKADCLPYSIEEEQRILRRMRQQVLDAGRFYENLKKGFKTFDRKDKMYKILYTIFLGMVIGLATYSVFSAALFTLITAPTNILNFKKWKEVRKTLKGFKNTMDDYEKSLAFVQNSNSFSNKKVMKPRVIDKSSDKVKFIISSGIICDKYEECPTALDSVPYVDYRLFNDPAEIPTEEQRKESDEYERESIRDGYTDVSDREVPFINENTIGDMSYKELYGLYKLSNPENKGKVLVKLKEYKVESLNR